MRDDVLAAKILEARVEVNRQDKKLGFTALHIAAKATHHGMVKLLVDARAETATMIKSGKSAADLAALNGASTATMALLHCSGNATLRFENTLKERSCISTIAALTAEQRASLYLD